jgi:isoquinoline 1-oxidoreductase subunit beta
MESKLKTATGALLPRPPRLTRRRLLVGGAAGIGLAIGYVLWPRNPQLNLAARQDETILNGWLKIGTDGRIVVIVPQAEMGQGVYTSLPMIVAEELGARWDTVSVEPAPMHPVYANRIAFDEGLEMLPAALRGIAGWVAHEVVERYAIQITGGSTSVRSFHQPLRLAAAAARDMLRKTAARQWSVDWHDCVAADGSITFRDKQATFASLAGKALAEEVPDSPELKKTGLYSIVGKNVPRLDIPAKTDGSAGFGADVRLPGMVYAAVKGGPINEGWLMDVEDRTIRGTKGIQGVVKGKSWFAVVADRYWQAKTAMDSLKPDFNFRSAEQMDSIWISGAVHDALAKGNAHVYEREGDALDIISSAKKTITATYEVPYLAHAALETMNATARVNVDGSVEIWGPVQSITLVTWSVAKALAIEAEKIRVYPTLIGGGFGIKAEAEACVQAAVCARQMGKPVQVIWSREEDFKQDKFRPAAMAQMAAALDGKGGIAAWHARLAGQSASGSFGGRYFPAIASDEPDFASVQGATGMPYDLPARQISHALAKAQVPVGFWRSVGHSYTSFFVESFIDEIAHATDADPVTYRLAMLTKAPRHAKVLQECVARAGPKVEGRGRGYALHESFGSIVAQAADVSISDSGDVEVKRVVCVVDCGSVIHPDTVIGQMEGGIIFGLSAALFGKVEFQRGQPTVANFDGYPLLTLAQTPDIDVHIIESGAPIGGIGEVAVPPIAPAVTNAIFDITGVRIRKLPIAGQRLLSAEMIKQRQAMDAAQGGEAVNDGRPGAASDSSEAAPESN